MPPQLTGSAETVRSGIRLSVAVGTSIADRPPHRSVRALLRIRLPLRMIGVEALHRIRMEHVSDWNPSIHEPGEPGQGDTASWAAARWRSPPAPTKPPSENMQPRQVAGHSVVLVITRNDLSEPLADGRNRVMAAAFQLGFDRFELG